MRKTTAAIGGLFIYLINLFPMLGIELWSSYMLGKSPPELHPQPGFERGSEVEPRNAIASGLQKQKQPSETHIGLLTS
jgi:hypothetical protein